MVIYTIKKEFKKEFINKLKSDNFLYSFQVFETNFYAVFKFDFVLKKDEIKINKLINDIKNGI